jgi:SH3 domain protein
VKTVYPLLLTLLCANSFAQQDVRYISDQQYVPLRSGQGSEFRIIHRGLPSGTRLTIGEVSEESGYTEVTTPNGTQGWIRSQYLVSEEPAKQRLARSRESFRALQTEHSLLQKNLTAIKSSYDQEVSQLSSSQTQLEKTAGELAEVKRISAQALSLDTNNRRLIEQAEVLKIRIEVLEADNIRMLESSESTAFMNGAFAVLLGVIITLLVPRLWPQRRRSSSSWV